MTEQLEGQMSFFDLDSQFGKTYPAHSAPTKEKISGQSSRHSVTSGGGSTILYLCLREGNGFLPGASWETVPALPGVSMTLNTGESPSVARESTLSQILEANAREKYYLSPRACRGILNRAKKRGKELPKMLKEALEEVIALDSRAMPAEQHNPQDSCGGVPTLRAGLVAHIVQRLE